MEHRISLMLKYFVNVCDKVSDLENVPLQGFSTLFLPYCSKALNTCVKYVAMKPLVYIRKGPAKLIQQVKIEQGDDPPGPRPRQDRGT